jgi:hypothetical protein
LEGEAPCRSISLDPPGFAPVFISLTQGMTAAARREVAARGGNRVSDPGRQGGLRRARRVV